MRLARYLYRLDLLVFAAGLALVTMSLVAGSATGATPISDGSDWGPQGLLASASGQTARWDNTGNSTDSTVPRNSSQVLPHTDDKTYADVSSTDQTAFADDFGKDNGLGGLSVSVSQTDNLVAQAVTVSISGAVADIPKGQTASTTYFQVFQCWGKPGADGQPDPTATSPDPETCEYGAQGADTVGGSNPREYRYVAGDPLVGGDWAQYAATSQSGFRTEVPFVSITGAKSGPNLSNQNTLFDHTSTNELSDVTVPAAGATSRQFGLLSGTESSSLGCGARSDAPSTPTCWLVVVPRIAGYDDKLGATSPTVWAQRLQFKLGFQPIAGFCPSSGARSLLVGSEMLSRATSSWIPNVCDTKNVALSYTSLSDDLARGQFATTEVDAATVSNPVDAGTASVGVPLALTAPVVAFNYDYHPACTSPRQAVTKVTDDAGAKMCGYDNLADLQADLARANQPVRDLHLDARLMAKLLTMSYTSSMLQPFGVTLPDWTHDRPATLTADPEFQKLNPQLHLAPDQSNIGSMVLEVARSDAANAVWQWIAADPDAAAFLSGCPDASGVVINPYFSTRTYAGCPANATELAHQSQDSRDATTTPPGFLDQAQAYPPDSLPYPLPQWQEQAPVKDASGTVTQIARTLFDKQPRVDNMSVAARDAFTGYKPENGTFCPTDTDPVTCIPAPGRWKDDKTPQSFGSREVFTITDAPSAARYQLATASLCSDGGTCVGADTASLEAAAAQFTPSATPGYVQPAATADYAGGAYPLTLPVYAAVQPAASTAERASYADAFDYITTAGQVPGYTQGALPPGYAPLTSALKTAAAAAITVLRQPSTVVAVSGTVTSKSTKSKHKSQPSSSATASASATATPSASSSTTTGGGTTGGGDTALPGSPGGGSPSAGASVAAASSSAAPVTDVQTAAVAASTESWPGWVLPLGVGVALGAGMAGPFLRRRSSVRLR